MIYYNKKEINVESNKRIFAYLVGITDVFENAYTDTIYAETEAAAIEIAHMNPLNADVRMIGRKYGNRKL